MIDAEAPGSRMRMAMLTESFMYLAKRVKKSGKAVLLSRKVRTPRSAKNGEDPFC